MHLPVRVRKLHRLRKGSIRTITDIGGNSGLHFAMVQCLHQSNVYIKRKLGLWRGEKCIPLVGAKSALTCLGPQTTPSNVRQYRADNGNLGKSRATFCHGAVFAPKQCLYQKEARAMESPKMYSSSWCEKRTYLCGSANYPVSFKVVWGREQLLGEIRSYLSPWCSVCTKAMFISMAMESPKLYSCSRCKKDAYLFGSANYPVSCKAV